MSGSKASTNGISAPFIRYPIGTSLLMAGILFVGLVAYPLLPVAPLPQVDFPTIQVTASLPGAPAPIAEPEWRHDPRSAAAALLAGARPAPDNAFKLTLAERTLFATVMEARAQA